MTITDVQDEIRRALELPWIERNKGDCFQIAVWLMRHARQENLPWTLVHARVHGRGKLEGRVYDHAWVEADTEHGRFAIDLSSGNHVVLPADAYRRLGNAHDVTEYSRDVVIDTLVRHGHYGPWGEES